jgi:DNA-binding response OmpR family regulator
MLRVLVADDDLGTRETLRLVLSHEGYDVVLAHSGASAIDSLSGAHSAHAMLLDLRLGDISGFEILRWLRDESRFVPTAVITAFRYEFDPDEAIELGALAYVDRPLSLEAIVELVGSLTRPPCLQDTPNQLHARVRAGDPGAIECLHTIFLKQLPLRLRRAFPRAPADFAEDAVSTASFEYASGAARRFQDSRGSSVVDFVYAIAWRNLRDRLQSETSRLKREQRWALTQTTLSREAVCARNAPTLDVWAAILAVTKDANERRAARVWLDGGGTVEIAEALLRERLPPPDQFRAVKQFKDRMIKRLSRSIR